MTARTIFGDPAQQAKFDEQGYVELPILSPEQVEKLLDAMRKLHPADAFSPDGRYHCSFIDEDLGYKQQAYDLLVEHFAPFMAATLPGWQVISANFYIKPPGRGQIQPHQNWPLIDDPADTAMTVWCPLVDCTVENGTLHLVPASHKLHPHIETAGVPPYFADFEPALIRDHMMAIPVRAGHGVCFDDTVVHGSPNNGGSHARIAVQLECVPPGSRPVFYFADGDAGFDRIVTGPDFFTSHSVEMLMARQPGWVSAGHVPNRNRLLTRREFERLLSARRRRHRWRRYLAGTARRFSKLSGLLNGGRAA